MTGGNRLNSADARAVTIIWIGIAVALSSAPSFGGLSATAEFAGGSAVIRKVDQDAKRIRIEPAGDPKRGWPCWWQVRVDGIKPGSIITVEVNGGKMTQARGGDWRQKLLTARFRRRRT